MQLHINPWLQLCGPLFSYATHFCQNIEKLGADLAFFEKVYAQFCRFKHQTQESGCKAEHAQLASYALAALIDEKVMQANVPISQSWVERSLQLSLFGTHNAGEIFYEKIKRMQQDLPEYWQILEVYYNCLELGFAGKYRLHDKSLLLQVKRQLRLSLEPYAPSVCPELSLDAVPQTSGLEKVVVYIPLWVIVSVTVCILLFIYLGFSLAMDRQADKSKNFMRKLVESSYADSSRS